MAPDPLSPESILQAVAQALPTHDKDDTTSDLSSSLDAISILTHACMVNLGFRLVGFNEDQKIESECAKLAPRLSPKWNQSLSHHSFVYAHTQSSMQFVIHIDRLGSKIEVRGLAINDERIARFGITARDYISSSALPVRIKMTTEGNEDRSDLASRLQEVYINQARLNDFASLLKISIIQRLVPGLQKEGYVEDPDAAAARLGPAPARPQDPPHLPPPAQPNPYPAPDPLADVPPRPIPAGDFPPPGFDDEYEVNQPPRGPLHIPGGGFGNIGRDDLYPAGLGPHDPLRQNFIPQPGIGPMGLRRPQGGGGMHPTFDDPLFMGPRGEGDGSFDGQVPPGARYDPLGPGGQPRFGGGRPGGRGGFGGAGFGGFGGGII